MTELRRACLAALLACAGCTDLGGYAGRWSGGVVRDPSLLIGLPATSQAVLELGAVDRVSTSGTLTLDGEAIALRPLARAMNDALGALELPDSPLQSYFLVAPLASGDAIALVSLYPNDRVDLRLIRSDALYAVFHLARM